MINRTVRFYSLRILQNDAVQGSIAEAGFWARLAERIDDRPPESLEQTIRGRRIFGEHRVGRQPARPYFYVGRVRDRAEWPDTLRDNVVGRLELQEQEAVLLEPAYIVPFGQRNQVAVMSMSQSAPSVSALEEWVTVQAGMDLQKLQASLIPILKPDVQARLQRAQGAVMLTVEVPPLNHVPEGGGQIGRAAREARQVSTETTFSMRWSLGNKKGAQTTTSELLDGARWVDDTWASSAEVSLDVPDDEGVMRREAYNLVKHKMTLQANLNVPDDQHATELSVLTGMTEAIEQFGRVMR